MLVQPAFTRYHLELGEISTYPPGYKENGSIFCHVNPWIMIGETMLGHGDAAFEYYQRTNPSARAVISDVHRCEPYVYAQTIAGRDAPSFGEAKNSWLTGSASWHFVAISQWILRYSTRIERLADRPGPSRVVARFQRHATVARRNVRDRGAPATGRDGPCWSARGRRKARGGKSRARGTGGFRCQGQGGSGARVVGLIARSTRSSLRTSTRVAKTRRDAVDGEWQGPLHQFVDLRAVRANRSNLLEQLDLGELEGSKILVARG